MLEVVAQTKANVGKSSKEDNEAYNGFKKTLKIALSGWCFVCLFDLILYVPSTIFQL